MQATYKEAGFRALSGFIKRSRDSTISKDEKRMPSSSISWLQSATQQSTVAETAGVSTFIGNLCKMLDDALAKAFVCWGASGDSIVVLDHVRFSSVILPKYYKHSNFASFVRQLNLYGFRKINQDAYSCEFSHPEFRSVRLRAQHEIIT